MSRNVLLYVLLQYVPTLIFSAKNGNSISVVHENCVDFDVADLKEYILRLNLSNIPTVEMMAAGFKCPVTALPFGALKSDWSRLLMLHNAQSDGTILKTKLRRLFRLLVTAYYRMEESFSVSIPSNSSCKEKNKHEEKVQKETTTSSSDTEALDKLKSDNSYKSSILPTIEKGILLAKQETITDSSSRASTYESNRADINEKNFKEIISSAIPEEEVTLEKIITTHPDVLYSESTTPEFLTMLWSSTANSSGFSEEEDFEKSFAKSTKKIPEDQGTTFLVERYKNTTNVKNYESVEKTKIQYSHFTQPIATTLYDSKEFDTEVKLEETRRTTIETSDFHSSTIDNFSGERDFPQSNSVFGIYNEHESEDSKLIYTVDDPYLTDKFDRRIGNEIKRPYVFWKPENTKNILPLVDVKPSSLSAYTYGLRSSVYPHLQGQNDPKTFLRPAGSNGRKTSYFGHEKRGGSNTNVEKLYRWFYRQGQRWEKDNPQDSMSGWKQEKEKIDCKNEE